MGGIVKIEKIVDTATKAVENSASPSYFTAKTVNSTPIGADAGTIEANLACLSMKGQNTNAPSRIRGIAKCLKNNIRYVALHLNAGAYFAVAR